MAEKVFYSFHYVPDNWRVAQVRNMGVLEGNQLLSDNTWETIASQGDTAIKNWISGQMSGKSCIVVLVGTDTASRKWVKYEIEKAWADKKGVVAIHVHNLKDKDGKQSIKGANPLTGVKVGSYGTALSTLAKCYDPPYGVSTSVYSHIESNISTWVDEAIKIRKNN